MFGIFDIYVLKNCTAATCVTAVTLTLIVLLTQSIRYLELVIGSDASSYYFLLLIALAIPKFLEAIMPLAFAIGVVYAAHRFMHDREVTIMNAAGASVFQFGRGFLIFTALMMVFQFILSGWLSPMAVNELQKTRGDVKSHYATLMFREGVFNTLGNGLTVYVEDRQGLNELNTLTVHDDGQTLNPGKTTTIIAERGIVNLNDQAQQLLVYNGTQYMKDEETGQIARLDFDQYTLDIPMDNRDITARWRAPDERLFTELFLSPETSERRDLSKQSEFTAEIHKRISTPFFYACILSFVFLFLFMGEWNRRSLSVPLIKIGVSIAIIQTLHIVFYNEAQDNVWMNLGQYAVIGLPFAAAVLVMRARL